MRRARPALVAGACALVALALPACGSDKDQPTQTTPASTIDARQSPGPNGNNNSGQSPTDSAATATTAGAQAPGDTQLKEGDAGGSGGGGSPGLPGASVP
jgi:hypothetical protein